MNSILVKMAGLASLMILPAFAPVHAQQAQPAAGEAMQRASEVAVARISQDLSHEQIAVINLVAHATAAAGLCEDLTLDETAVYGALAAVTHEARPELSSIEAMRHRDFALIAFGVMSGIMLREAAGYEAEFCAEAVALANDPQVQTFLRQTSTAVPYQPEPPKQQ